MTKVEKATKKKELRKQKSEVFEMYRTGQINLAELQMRSAFITGQLTNYNN